MKLLSFILLIITPALSLCQPAPSQAESHRWWNDVIYLRPYESPNAKKLPRITVKGNKFVNTLGDTILFRGLAISDPDNIERHGHWNRTHFEKVKEMGAMLVRIPVHPAAWRNRTPQKYLAMLDQAVDWCTDLGTYVIIDWHSIGNLRMELFQDPDYDTSLKETYEFWRTIARHYRGNNTVAFYEIFNEPTTFNGRFGRMSWSEWKKINEDIIDLIRAYDAEPIPLVAGLDWAYDLTPLRIEPIEAAGIAYVTHPYPHKRTPPWPDKWEEDFGFAASTYPVIATEFGFTGGTGGMADNGDYGRTIVHFLESHGISWTAWVFDPIWLPPMMKSWDNYDLTESGEFFKQALHGNLAK